MVYTSWKISLVLLFPACPCGSMLYLATPQVLDSLVIRGAVTFFCTFAWQSKHAYLVMAWVMPEFVNWTVTPFDFKGCYIPSRYSILEINQQVIYIIFNRNLHTFSKWVWYAIWIQGRIQLWRKGGRHAEVTTHFWGPGAWPPKNFWILGLWNGISSILRVLLSKI